ncbi:MAG: 6-pyruvoyl trahydropterin synthase family protein [Planctomycetota bacterium]|jgi:6-pyruvoyltetrahydropterin/6-carboxytetrahydropterin synthase
MHKLARQVRFSINPFLSQESGGFNSFASKPAGEGLAIFLELSVEVLGDIRPDTGFVVNVVDIDRGVREFVVPVFAERIRRDYGQGRHIELLVLAELLRSAWGRLSDKFSPAILSKLSLKLNPFRRIAVSSKDLEMVYFCEKFEFAAMHKLWNDDFSEQKNFEVFGKCANPTGHGHNYVVEIAIEMPAARDDFRIGDFERIVDDELIKLLDHRNLNVDVEQFGRVNPTIENIAAFAWDKLVGRFGEANLNRITVWETDKTYCTYYDG